MEIRRGLLCLRARNGIRRDEVSRIKIARGLTPLDFTVNTRVNTLVVSDT